MANPGSEQSRKRAENRYAILRTLHLHGPLQRATLSRLLGVRKTSVTSITAEAIRQGVLTEQEPRNLRTTLVFPADKIQVAVARLGRQEVESARVLCDGSVMSAKSFPFALSSTASQILDTAEKALRYQIKRPGPAALGIGFADVGIVDCDSGVTKLASSLPQWRDVPVRAELERRLGLGVVLDTDVRSQLWASAWFDRHLKDARSMFYIGLLEGVAGALLLDGALYSGSSFSAGEFGHIRAGSGGRACGCGKLDCLETYCSLPAIMSDIRRIRPRFNRADDAGSAIARLAEEDEAVRKYLRSLALKIVGVTAPILAALDPDALVFGSPSPYLTSLMGNLVHAELQRELAGLRVGGIRLILAGADHQSTLRGIGGRVFERCFRLGTPSIVPVRDS